MTREDMWIYEKLLLTDVLWAGTFIAGRILGTGGRADPASAAFLRFFFASVIMIILVKTTEKRLPRLNIRQWVAMFLLGLTGVFLYHILFLTGLKTVDAANASVIIATSPVFISLLSAYVFKENITPAKFTGIIISVFGAIYVTTRGDFNYFFNNGISYGQIFIIGCLICWVLYSIIGKILLEGLSPIVTVAYSSVIGTILLFFIALYKGIFGEMKLYFSQDWLSIIYLAVFGTVVGYIWFCEALNKIGPQRTSLFFNFIPIFTIIQSYFILGEPITHSLLVGTPLVIFGVYITNKTKPQSI
jgi:drug/metabolite transporter (DMT)-like permease